MINSQTLKIFLKRGTKAACDLFEDQRHAIGMELFLTK